MGQNSHSDRVRLESEMREHPDSLVGEKAYFRFRRTNAREDVIYFPVVIKDSRVSFGKIHFLILPFSAVGLGLGSKWVERKQLILAHDHLFPHLNASFFKELSQCPTPFTNTRDFDDPRSRHRFYDPFFTDHPDIARLQRGFFQLGKNTSKDVLYFPIQIENGRKSFGQSQYLIVPYGSIIASLKVLSDRSNVGCIWVGKKALTMEYHMKFEELQPFFEPFSQEKLLFDVEENDETQMDAI